MISVKKLVVSNCGFSIVVTWGYLAKAWSNEGNSENHALLTTLFSTLLII